MFLTKMGDQIETEIEQILESVAPRKHRRKEPLMLKPLNDFHLEFEDQPVAEVPEVKRKPRKEYKTKKRLAMQKKLPEQPVSETKQRPSPSPSPTPTSSPTPEPKVESSPEQADQHKLEAKQELEDIKQPKDHKESPKEIVVERRTRLSNTCRVATGKSYKCTSCEFSTDRINNIILHMKESCPRLKTNVNNE